MLDSDIDGEYISIVEEVIKNDGNSKSIVMSIPFEAIIDFEQRNRLMLEIMDYFNN